MPTEDKSAATGKTGASPEPVKLEANTATSPGSPSKRELAFSTNGNENGNENENEEDAEEVDSEEDFLQHIEQEEAEKESTADNHQSSNAKDAPRLLQDALKKGDVEPDDSEEEEKKDAKEEEGDSAAAHAVTDKKKSVVADAIEGNAEEHVHQRANQLDFLLSKASEYSNFIAADLQELQEQMADDARRKLESTSKKRKKGATGKNKKGKNSKGEANLKSAQDKYSETTTDGNAADPSFLNRLFLPRDVF